jgi:hypothetical protein
LGELIENKKDLHSGAESGILKGVDRNSISLPIETGRTDGASEPWAIARHGKPLNDRQQALLDNLPEYDSKVEVDRSDVSMVDLAALTAKTGDEFAMFTRGAKRLIVRGDFEHVDVNMLKAGEMKAQGYKWSGHTHVKVGDLLPSDGDRVVLGAFEQEGSVIYDSEGRHRRFFI